MEKPTPIKRHPSLRPLSRDHHHGLLLCWKIRQGFKMAVDVQRIKDYTDWFWENQLKQHFEEEERLIFPILGNEHEMIKKVLAEHRRLKRLFEDQTEFEKSLSLIEEELEHHIRFEERVLFNEIQLVATQKQLEVLEEHLHQDAYCEIWKDQFWDKNNDVPL